jgi:copper homeostasis protein CutC
MEIAPHDQTVADKVRAFHRTLEAAFERALTNARDRGEIASPAAPSVLARYLVTAANGMAVAAKAGATRENLQDVAGVALSTLVGRH